MGKLYAGVLFYRDDESGIAKVSLYNDTKSEYVEQDQLVDLYIASKDATNGEYESFIYWIKLPYPNDSYTFTVEHSGYHNVSAGGSYDITHNGFIYIEELSDGEVETKVYSYHSDHEGNIYSDTMTPGELNDITKKSYFNGDGIEDEFAIDGSEHAYDFLYASVDSGANWLYPSDTSFTWGSNSPDYDNETIDDDGYFTIKFITPPEVGTNNVIIHYTPKRDKAYVERTFKFPNDSIDYYDVRGELRLLDDVVEFVR